MIANSKLFYSEIGKQLTTVKTGTKIDILIKDSIKRNIEQL